MIVTCLISTHTHISHTNTHTHTYTHARTHTQGILLFLIAISYNAVRYECRVVESIRSSNSLYLCTLSWVIGDDHADVNYRLILPE